MTGLLAALGLVALNGFFVAAEFSFVRVRPAGLERLAIRPADALNRQGDESLQERGFGQLLSIR